MMKYSEFNFGDMLVTYFLDSQDRMSMRLIPASMAERVLDKVYHNSAPKSKKTVKNRLQRFKNKLQ